MSDYRERLFIVTYDISDQRRWRQVFKCMKGFGEWLQFSVFQCRLTAMDRAELVAELDALINQYARSLLYNIYRGANSTKSASAPVVGKTRAALALDFLFYN